MKLTLLRIVLFPVLLAMLAAYAVERALFWAFFGESK